MRRLLALLSLFSLACLSVLAGTISLDPGLFGNLDQHDTNCAESACGPTAAVNSFAFLENMYPTIYGNDLIPTTGATYDYGDLVDAADVLAGSTFMDCTAAGVGISNFISGEEAYMNEYAPGTTVFEIMNFFANGAWPTFNFLYNQLAAGEDVELLVGFYTTNAEGQLVRNGGHYVTLTGVSFGVPFAAGNGTISFIDPDDGDSGSMSLSTIDGALYNNGTYVNGQYTFIEAAVAESPTPEPGTLLFLAVGIPALFVLRRRKPA
jgi:hypothetical protein